MPVSTAECQLIAGFRYYLSAIEKILFIDGEEFRDGYYLLTLQRNLQILGAFAYLSQVKGKNFFRSYINPALHKLYCLLIDDRGKDFPHFRKLLTGLCDRVGIPIQ